MLEKDDAQIVKVRGDQAAKDYADEHPAPPAYSRIIHAKEVTFTCIRCHQAVTEVRYPGPTTYCAACSIVVKREKTAARTRRSRSRKKERET